MINNKLFATLFITLSFSSAGFVASPQNFHPKQVPFINEQKPGKNRKKVILPKKNLQNLLFVVISTAGILCTGGLVYAFYPGEEHNEQPEYLKESKCIVPPQNKKRKERVKETIEKNQKEKKKLLTHYPADPKKWSFTPKVYTNLCPISINVNRSNKKMTTYELNKLLNEVPDLANETVGTKNFPTPFDEFIVYTYQKDDSYLPGLTDKNSKEQFFTCIQVIINNIGSYPEKNKRRQLLKELHEALRNCQAIAFQRIAELSMKHNKQAVDDLGTQFDKIIEKYKKTSLSLFMYTHFSFLKDSDSMEIFCNENNLDDKDDKAPLQPDHFMNTILLYFEQELGFDTNLISADRYVKPALLKNEKYSLDKLQGLGLKAYKYKTENFKSDFVKGFKKFFEEEGMRNITNHVENDINNNTNPTITAIALQKKFRTISDLSPWQEAGLLKYDGDNNKYVINKNFVYFLLEHTGYIQRQDKKEEKTF